MALRRKKTFVVPREAAKLGPYDERPMLPDTVQSQICLSRNDRPQPFFLVCEKDTMLAVFSGAGRVHMREVNVLYYELAPADYVYIPAGTPTRIEPEGELVVLRYKAREPGLEAVAWYCDRCREPLFRHTFDTAETFPQEGYLAGCEAFNAEAARRSCPACEQVHEPVDLAPYRWQSLAAELRAE